MIDVLDLMIAVFATQGAISSPSDIDKYIKAMIEREPEVDYITCKYALLAYLKNGGIASQSMRND